TGYGISGQTIDGTDVPKCYAAVREAVARARRGEGPTLIDAKVWRINSHTSEDNQGKYRTKEELAEAPRHDPLIRFTKRLVERRWITTEEAAEGQATCDREASEAADWAERDADSVAGEPQKSGYAGAAVQANVE